MPVTTRRWAFLFYYLVCAAAIVMMFGEGAWMTSLRLARLGVPVQGALTAAACGSDTPLAYRFDANGVNYQGRGKDGFGNPPCAKLHLGDPILVYHLSDDPSINLPGNPGERFVTEASGILMAALFVPLVLLFLFFITLRILGSSPRGR